MKLITRQTAKIKKLRFYYTGKPCPQGHITRRLTINKSCHQCCKDWLNANKDKTKQHRVKWRTLHPDKYNEGKRKWRRKNLDKVRFYSLKWKRNNPDKHAANNKRWRLENVEAHKAIARNRRARKQKAAGKHTGRDIKRLFFRQHGKCAADWCGVSIINGYHVDHKIPLSRGGSNWPRNLQLLCQPCNDSKGSKTMNEWKKTLKAQRLLEKEEDY